MRITRIGTGDRLARPGLLLVLLANIWAIAGDPGQVGAQRTTVTPGARHSGCPGISLPGTIPALRVGVCRHRGASVQATSAAAAREFQVPEAVLLAVSYNLTRWQDHDGAPSMSGGYGPMHLTHVNWLPRFDERGDGTGRRVDVRGDRSLHTLDLAARLLHVSLGTLERNPAQNIRGGAALLARYARATTGRIPAAPGEWYGAVAAYSGSRDAGPALSFADAVYRTIDRGEAETLPDGERVQLPAQRVVADTATVHRLHLHATLRAGAQCPPDLTCHLVPAAYAVNNPLDPTDYGNYDVANRPKYGPTIWYIVIHDTEGPYAGAISSFQDPKRYASANYVIRSADGDVTQMVPNKDIAWHAGNYYVNMHAIGIEHEGVAAQGATWYSEQMYAASADLVRYLAGRYHVPLDRAHILGHDEVPGPTPKEQSSQHWDPGPFWDWGHYMNLLGATWNRNDITSTSIVTIAPTFADNQPNTTFCAPACTPLPAQPTNFVYLRTAPQPDAPLFGDPALHGPADVGTTRIDDWGDKAVTGAQYAVADTQGDWTAIYYAGHKVWFYDPAGSPVTVAGSGKLVSPRPGLTSIRVYGSADPEKSAYPSSIPAKDRAKIVPLQYTIPTGQQYVATDLVTADFYWSPTQKKHAVVKGKARYYQIFFNHRAAFVRLSDVTVRTVR